MNPLVSVIINTYNYGRFIEETIDSALAQDFPADQMEVLVVDDGSTDDTAERVKKYGDRIRYFYKENGDQCSAITFGADRAKGELLAFLDGDDLWFPNKLSRAVQEFAKDSRVVMVYNRLTYWDSRDNAVWVNEWPADVSGDVLADRRKLLKFIHAPTSALVFRRETFQRLRDIPMHPAFSYDLYLTIAVLFLGPIAYVPEPLTKYRVHGSNRWFAGRTNLDPTTVRRRIGRQAAAIEITREWMRANVPKSLRPQARLILRQWSLRQEADRFVLEPPGRLRTFVHNARHNLIYGTIMTREHLAYRWAHAFFELLVGPKHSHYLEGIRTRARRLKRHFQGSNSAQPAAEVAGRRP